MVFPVPHGRRIMPQQPEGNLVFLRHLGLFAEMRQSVFEVLLVEDRHEFQLYCLAGARCDDQAGHVFGFVVAAGLQ